MTLLLHKIRNAWAGTARVHTALTPAVTSVGRLYILPTRYGLLFFPVLFGMLIGSVNYNNNLAFLLTFLLAAMTLVNLLHTHSTLAGLRITGVHGPPVFAGGPASLTLWITSVKPNQAVFQGQPVQTHKAPLGLSPTARDRIVVSIARATRGYWRPGPLNIQTSYPSGLFKAWRRVEVNTMVLVYPRPLGGAPRETEFEGHLREGGSASVRSGSDEFYDLRVWRPGDPRQHVAWKASVRANQPLTKTFQQPHGRRAWLFDYAKLKLPDLETRLSRLCGLIVWAHQQHQPFGLQLPGTRVSVGQGEPHLRQCLKALAVYGLDTA